MEETPKYPLIEKLERLAQIALPMVIFWSISSFLFSWSYIRSINSGFVKYFSINDFYYLAFEKLDAIIVFSIIPFALPPLFANHAVIASLRRKVSKYLIPLAITCFACFFAAGEFIAALNERHATGAVTKCDTVCSATVEAEWFNVPFALPFSKAPPASLLRRLDDNRDHVFLVGPDGKPAQHEHELYVFGTDYFLSHNGCEFLVRPVSQIAYIKTR